MNNNKDLMTFLIIAGKLTVICFTAVVLLILVNLITSPIINKNNIKTEKEANQKLIPQGDKFELKYFPFLNDTEKDDNYYYEVKNRNSELIGYIVASKGNGYGGKLKILTAFDINLKILNVKLMDNNETPGLGKKAEKSRYMNKFIGTNTPDNPFPKTKSMLPKNEADSVTGATITFNGITSGIQKAIENITNEVSLIGN